MLCICAHVSCLIHYRYLLFIYCAHLFFVVVNLFCSLFDYSFILLFDFISHQFFVLLLKEKKNNSDPELVFRYFDPVVPVQVHLHTIINTSQ
jgi:hypothetical protein